MTAAASAAKSQPKPPPAPPSKKKAWAETSDEVEAVEFEDLDNDLELGEDDSLNKAAASATFIKERRINIRLSTPDLMDIQARALEEGLPYQTFIASVLHKYISGRLVEKPSRLTSRSSGRGTKRRAA